MQNVKDAATVLLTKLDNPAQICRPKLGEIYGNKYVISDRRTFLCSSSFDEEMLLYTK